MARKDLLYRNIFKIKSNNFLNPYQLKKKIKGRNLILFRMQVDLEKNGPYYV